MYLHRVVRQRDGHKTIISFQPLGLLNTPSVSPISLSHHGVWASSTGDQTSIPHAIVQQRKTSDGLEPQSVGKFTLSTVGGRGWEQNAPAREYPVDDHDTLVTKNGGIC